MTRFLYVCLLRLHPQRFRQRFAEEMLWIFDQAADSRSVTRLFADALYRSCGSGPTIIQLGHSKTHHGRRG